MPRPRLYKDDPLVMCPVRLSKKYEKQYFIEFIDIFRAKPALAKAFIEKHRINNVDNEWVL